MVVPLELRHHFPLGLEPHASRSLVDVVSGRGFLEAYERIDMLALGVVDAGDEAWETTELKGPIGEGDLLGVPSDVVSSTEARRGLVARIA